jgi:photosystem II stability/assembly factor-like uncharacterized protein
MPTSFRARAVLLIAASIFASPIAAQRGGAPPARAPQDPLRFQMMGPATGGRFASVTGVPGDLKTWYIGAASGGVWKSSDSGQTFRPVFDSMPVQAIGALAVATTQPTTVWAGTGEAWAIRDADVMGDGIYKSTDSGATWTNMGLRETGRIGRIIVHPKNPNIVFVCALGRATGPQEERGVYRTLDGGKTWQRVLFVDQNTGCSGLTIDLKNPNVVFAGMWQVEMHTWAMFSGGPGSGIHVSRDGGATWSKVTHPGLPKSPVGKIDVAVAPTNSNRVYALIQTADQGSLWRSDDGGKAWRVINWQRPLIGRAGYYIHLAVSSGNPDEILVANSSFFRSMDGGTSFQEVPWGGDNHDIWIDPKNPNHFALTNDASARLTTDHGRTFISANLPIGQMYHVAVDNQIPYWVYSNRQDNGTMRGPSTAPEGAGGGRGGGGGGGRGAGGEGRGNAAPGAAGRGGAGRGGAGRGGAPADSAARRLAGGRDTSATRADTTNAEGGGRGGGGGFPATSTWEHGVGGCESGFTLPDPTDADIVWASCYGNQVTRWDSKTKRARSVSPWIHTLDSPPTATKYRCHWTPPLAIDPFDPKTVYYGCQVIFKTSNEGQTWSVISPDLSTKDPSRIVSSGGVVGDNLGQFYGEVVFAIAPSEIERGLIWAGTNDGQVWITRDGGSNWTNVSSHIVGMPPWGTIRKIEPSRFEPGTAYIAVDFHMMDNREPYIYKTTSYGQTWSRVNGDLPTKHPLAYVLSVAENPNRKGMLFAGTGNGFYYSLDDGAHWTRFNNGLPAAPVTWIVTPKLWHDVVVSTYGRGIYILKDITPLEQGAGTQVADAAPTLYQPRPGYRQARSGRADITFALKSATPRPMRVEILDSTGAMIRAITTPTRAGLNRASWDLRYEPPRRVELRTTPPENPHIFNEPRFRGRGTRPITHWGIQGPVATGPIAAPGSYSARITVDGKTYTQLFKVLKDLDVKTSEADLLASTHAQIRIRDDMNATVDMVNRLEVMRRQIEDQRKAAQGKSDVIAALDDLNRKMLEVELQLVSRSDLMSDDKYYVEAYKVYMNLVWLSGEIGNGAGDVAGGADFRPTDASLAVLGEIERDLAAAKAAFTKLMEVDVPAFNKANAGKIATIADQSS